MHNCSKFVAISVSQNCESVHSKQPALSFLWFCMHELLTNCGTLGNYIFIKLICSSHLFKVTVINTTFFLPEARGTPRDMFLILLLLSSPPPYPFSFYLWCSSVGLPRQRQWRLLADLRAHPVSGHEKWATTQTGALTSSKGKKVCEEEKKHHV